MVSVGTRRYLKYMKFQLVLVRGFERKDVFWLIELDWERIPSTKIVEQRA
jgi:hypothetical protein